MTLGVTPTLNSTVIEHPGTVVYPPESSLSWLMSFVAGKRVLLPRFNDVNYLRKVKLPEPPAGSDSICGVDCG